MKYTRLYNYSRNSASFLSNMLYFLHSSIVNFLSTLLKAEMRSWKNIIHFYCLSHFLMYNIISLMAVYVDCPATNPNYHLSIFSNIKFDNLFWNLISNHLNSPPSSIIGRNLFSLGILGYYLFRGTILAIPIQFWHSYKKFFVQHDFN